MWLKFGFLVLFLCCVNAKFIINGNCDMPNGNDEWDNKDFSFVANDTDDTSKTKSYEISNIKNVTLSSSKYVTSTLEENGTILKFSLTEQFQNYIENEDSDRFVMNVVFECTEGTVKGALTLIVRVTKEYPPKLIDAPYSFKLVIPILANKIIENVNIKAKDLSFGNQQLVFTVTDECEEYFQFTESTKTNKIYSSYLKSKKIIQLEKSLTCKIKVKDKTFSDESEMKLEVDVENSQAPNPIFEKPLYEAKLINNGNLEVEDIKLINTLYKPEFKIHSEFEKNFQFKNNKLSITTPLPSDAFENKKYLEVIIEATYTNAQFSGKTVVIISSLKETIAKIPIFEEPLYIAKYVNQNKIDHPKIKLKSSENNITFDIISDYKNFFEFTAGQLVLSKPLLEDEFSDRNFISVIIEATYNPTKESGKTTVIINSPKIGSTSIPNFEYPLYLIKYVNETTLKHEDIKLISSERATFEIISDYKDFFKFKNNQLVLEKPLPKAEFENKAYIIVIISATKEGSVNSAKTVLLIQSPFKNDINYPQEIVIINIDPKFEGKLGTFTAVSKNNENIKYSIQKSDIKKILTYGSNGDLVLNESIPDVNYFQITLLAHGEISENEDIMNVILIINSRIDEDSKFKYSLLVENVDENSNPTVIVSSNEDSTTCISIVDEASKDWFEVDECNLLIKTIDREDARLKNMITAQVKTKIKIINKNEHEIQDPNFSLEKVARGNTETQKIDEEQKCIDITTISSSRDIMHVVVTINDLNDNLPKFDQDLLLIGYPNPDLLQFIFPPYLVKITATDDDIGINAKIKYSVDNGFKIDSNEGIVFPGNELKDDTEFVLTATDKDGNGNSALLNVKVKILKMEHISIMTLNNVSYSNVDEFINQISEKTHKYIRHLAAESVPSFAKKSFYKTDVDNNDSMPILRLFIYGFHDDGSLLTAKELEKEIKAANIDAEIQIKEYATLEYADDCSYDDWIAAVSTLAVLLILIIIGTLIGYFIYIRPRLLESSNYYKRNITNESIHIAPVENKIESTVADRRPTGFPIGFNIRDLEDDEESENKDEEFTEVKEDFYSEVVDAIDSKIDQERRKSAVTFNNNVTEIEIEKL